MRPTVLVFSGLDPSGGAGIAADLLAIAAQGVHALPLVTALTVQDQNRVHAVTAVDPALLTQQAQLLMASLRIDAVKLGIPGSRANAEAIAALVLQLRARQPDLPVVLDPVLASGHGDALARGDARTVLAPLLALMDSDYSVVVPNLAEAAAIEGERCANRLITGGHGDGLEVLNRWCGAHGETSWRWPRLEGEFHGSGCTLAAAIAARLALGESLAEALERAQAYTHQCLAASFSVGPGQRIPQRISLGIPPH